MTGNTLDLNQARRFYAADEEEEAVELVDKILGISGLSDDAAFQNLQGWVATAIQFPSDYEISENPTGPTILTVSNGVEAPLTSLGWMGLCDALTLRSMALSAIVYGPSHKDRLGYADRALSNAQFVCRLFPTLQFGEEGELWCLAAQPTMVAVDESIVEMGFGMFLFALEEFPELATHVNNQYFFQEIMPQARERFAESVAIQQYWLQLRQRFDQARRSGQKNLKSDRWATHNLEKRTAPNLSEYSKSQVEKKGPKKGWWKGIWRAK